MAATGIDVLYIDSNKQQPGLAVAAAISTAADDSSAEDTFLIGTAVEDAEECCRQEFELSMVAHGLSQLGLSASGTHQVYQRLEITRTDLQDPQAITHCQHIQQLVLSGNCLTTLQPLSQLKHLTSLDVSNNRLTAVLEYHVQAGPQASAAAHASSNASTASRKRSSNLRKADLSYNSIDHIGDLSSHSNLQELILAGNHLQRIGRSLEPLRKLRRLDLCSNSVRSCEGLQGLCSLQELSLDGNRISSLQPLSGLSHLQVLSAAHNQVTRLDGVEGLSSLRVLDVGGNQLRRVEALAACGSLSLLTSLNVAGNPVEAAQNVRLHMVHLLTQLQQLNGVEVTVVEKVDAGNMVGAATDGLVLIRRQFFPNGELEDGGGAVPPTAAGLKVSQASEERSSVDPSSMFAAIDGWAQSVQPSLALQPLVSATGFGAVRTSSLPTRASNAGPVSAQQSAGRGHAQAAQPAGSNAGSRRTSRAGSSSAGNSRPVSNEGARLSANLSAKQLPAQPGGAAAIAARLAAGCCPEAPYRQLQLLRACYCWVLTHVELPKDCDLEAGPELVTWDVRRHVFGEGDKQVLLQEVLLPGYTGTWAECVSQLLVNLLRACHMEAQQLSGFWKAGGLASVGPGEQLVTHNHSWVAAKVNGLWRLLDPVYAMIMAARDQPLPFFLPPEAFIHTHLPFEPCWQLLPQPVRTEEWWARPELALSFAAAGGRLLDGGSLWACTVIELDREALVLPTVRIPIAAPANPQQHLRISLLDSSRQLLASWQHAGAPAQHNKLQHGGPQQDGQHSNYHAVGADCKCRSGANGCCLVFQQQVLGTAGQFEVQVGADSVQLVAQELWAALPGTGTFYVKVEQVTEVPGGMMPAVHVEGLHPPLSLTLRQYQDVTQLKVVVQSAAVEEASDSSSSYLYRPPVVACLPQPQAALAVKAGKAAAGDAVQLQLLSPEPGTLLEADRTQLFDVLAPAWASVAVGSEQSGWVVMQQEQQEQQQQTTTRDAGGSGADGSDEFCVFSGSVVLPRISTCYVAVQDSTQQQQQQDAPWIPVLGLHVRPPVQDLVPLLEEAHASSAAGEVGSPGSPVQSNAVHLLSALDVDGDGAASRKDMLLAFRRDRQLADHLKMPAKIRAGDGTFDTFLSKYIVINRSGLGRVGLGELAAYLASLAAATRSSSHSAGSRVATAARQPGSTSRGAVLTPKTPGTPATPLSKSGSGVRRSFKASQVDGTML